MNLSSRELALVAAGLVTVFVLALFMLLRLIFGKSQERMHRRLNGHDDSGASGILVQHAKQQARKGWAARLDRAFERMIYRTGLDLSPTEALGLIALMGIGLGVTFYLIREEVWLILLGLALGLGGTIAVFMILQSRYRRLMQDQLPDALYLMARSLRAGLSLDQAIELVGEHGNKPLAQEFQQCAAQIQLGLPVRSALEMTATRLRLTDFNAFVSTVTLYQITGGNLAQQLDRLAAGARDRNQFRGYFRSATALGRVTSGALAIAAPAVLLVYALARPDHVVPFFQSLVGWITVFLALLVELVGLIWLYFLLRVEY